MIHRIIPLGAAGDGLFGEIDQIGLAHGLELLGGARPADEGGIEPAHIGAELGEVIAFGVYTDKHHLHGVAGGFWQGLADASDHLQHARADVGAIGKAKEQEVVFAEQGLLGDGAAVIRRERECSADVGLARAGHGATGDAGGTGLGTLGDEPRAERENGQAEGEDEQEAGFHGGQLRPQTIVQQEAWGVFRQGQGVPSRPTRWGLGGWRAGAPFP